MKKKVFVPFFCTPLLFLGKEYLSIKSYLASKDIELYHVTTWGKSCQVCIACVECAACVKNVINFMSCVILGGTADPHDQTALV